VGKKKRLGARRSRKHPPYLDKHTLGFEGKGDKRALANVIRERGGGRTLLLSKKIKGESAGRNKGKKAGEQEPTRGKETGRRVPVFRKGQRERFLCFPGGKRGQWKGGGVGIQMEGRKGERKDSGCHPHGRKERGNVLSFLRCTERVAPGREKEED